MVYVTRVKLGVLFICIIIILSKTALGGEDRTYYSQAIEMTRVAKDVLVSRDICLSDNDCSRKKAVFWGASGQGVRITIYNIRDNAIVAELIKKLISWYVRNPDYDLEVVIFDRRWEDVSKISFFQDPILRLTVKHGGKK